LTTGSLRYGDTTFEITIDLVDHELVVRTLDGRTCSFPIADGSLSPTSTRRCRLSPRPHS
jgi:uncharacterized protein DUF5996